MSSQDFRLRFPSSTSYSSDPLDLLQGPYKLLELPPELCKVVESGAETQFTIRGRATDDAVLCTASKTYMLRAVTLSNTVVIATAPNASESQKGFPTEPQEELIVRDQVSQILELVPSVPKLNRLGALLKGCEYDEGHQRDEEASADDRDAHSGGEGEWERPRKRARFTRETIRAEVQASDLELSQGLKDHHVLEIEGHLRPLAPAYLTHVLETLLNAIVSEGLPLPPRPVPVHELVHHLDLEHEIPRNVVEQILPWFGDLQVSGSKFEADRSEGLKLGRGTNEDARWHMDLKEIVKQIGLGRLMSHKNESVMIAEFIKNWGEAVGDVFASTVDLALLEGNYLVTPAPAPSPSTPATPTHLSYFPMSMLPVTPTLLFADLFVTRPRWRAEDIVPFLRTVAVDAKERDKLLMKYARATTDTSGGVWYTARATLG